MKSLHMQTEEVIAVARKLAQTAQEIETQAGQIGQRVRGIPWEGSAREEYVERMNQLVGQLQQKAEEGMLLHQRMNREAEEWLGVDTKFADGYRAAVAQGMATPTQPATPNKPYDIPPRNLRDLAAYTMDKEGEPIKIVKVGENEYLVVLRGTKGGQGGNNWGGAITDGLGLPGDYHHQVEKIIRENIPPGATINFSGHSQGGLVADNLADDQNILDNYRIGQVYTFGAPSSGRGGDYSHRYAAEGDRVPFLDRHVIFPGIVVGVVTGKPWLGAATSVAGMWFAASRQNQIGVGSGSTSPHRSYSSSEDLRQRPLQFDQWDTNWNTAHNGQYQFGTKAESSLSRVEADLTSGDPLKIARGVAFGTVEVPKTAALGIANTFVPPVTDHLPKKLRNPVEGFIQRVNRHIIESGPYNLPFIR